MTDKAGNNVISTYIFPVSTGGVGNFSVGQLAMYGVKYFSPSLPAERYN